MRIPHKEPIVLIIVNTKTLRFYEVMVLQVKLVLRVLYTTVLLKFHGVVLVVVVELVLVVVVKQL